MRITEDPEDREQLFRRLTLEQFAVRAKTYNPVPNVGWVRQHQLWPCVRLGAGEEWLKRSGKWKPEPSKRRALNFLRGHSHEALMTDGNSLTIIYQGVACNVDEWTGDPRAPFTEIKSTMVSSARMYETVKRGYVKMLDPLDEPYFRHYFEQCLNYCVAVKTQHCRLRIFFQQGEYALRRKSCPQCGATLGDLVDDVYRPCTGCKHKSYAVDLRSYILTYTDEELVWCRKEVFKKRRDQYTLAVEAESVSQLLMRAEPTQCWICSSCTVGKKIGCEKAT